jgi:hypothetical protein
MAEIKTLKDLRLEIEKERDNWWNENGAYAIDFVLSKLDSFEAGLKSDALEVFSGEPMWKNICPSERRGAEMALIRVLLGVSWEKANRISFSTVTEKELRAILEGGGDG